MRNERTVRVLWALVALVFLLLVTKFFVADVYRISSGSMRPTIHGGRARPGDEDFSEWVLVRYDRGFLPERFDLVVVDLEGKEPAVKRVAGLPNESVRVVDGDLLIDGERLAPDAPRPEPIPVFDERLLDVEDYFTWKGAGADSPSPWRRDELVWTLDASEVAFGSNEGMMFYRQELRDDYFDHDGRRVVGRRTVNDAILECEFALDGGAGRLRFQLVEKGDTFEAHLQPAEEGASTSHVLQLVRKNQSLGGRESELVTLGVDLPHLRFLALRFANVDNHLTLELDGELLVTTTYERNEAHRLAPDSGDQSIGPRVGFGGEGVRARFRDLRVLRDLHYTASAEARYGVEEAVDLGPAEVFLLGDNSAISKDSRDYGPARLGELLGRPVCVVWPLERFRDLPGGRSSR